MDCKNILAFFSFTGTCTFIFTVPKLQHIKNPEPRLHQTHFRLESKDSKSKAHTLLKKKKKDKMWIKALIIIQNNCTVFTDIIFHFWLPLTLNTYNHHLNKAFLNESLNFERELTVEYTEVLISSYLQLWFQQPAVQTPHHNDYGWKMNILYCMKHKLIHLMIYWHLQCIFLLLNKCFEYAVVRCCFDYRYWDLNRQEYTYITIWAVYGRCMIYSDKE